MQFTRMETLKCEATKQERLSGPFISSVIYITVLLCQARASFIKPHGLPGSYFSFPHHSGGAYLTSPFHEKRIDRCFCFILGFITRACSKGSLF